MKPESITRCTRKERAEIPAPGNTVQMHYSGRLLSGQEFDNSYLRGEPFSFTLGEGRSDSGLGGNGPQHAAG